LFKIIKTPPHAYNRALESYATETIQAKFKDEITTMWKTEAGLPQGSVLGHVLPTSDNTTAVTSTDDTAVLAIHEDLAIASMKLQSTINKIEDWVQKWRIKINESKSKHITFTICIQTCLTVQI
jgi:hypothetical protein